MLPYTAEVWFALFDEYNRAIRPLQGVSLFLTASILMLALRSRENRSRIIVAILAAGWVWTGSVFHLVYFSEINFAAPVYGAVFILQGVLLFWSGVYRNHISIRFQRKPTSYAGAAIFILSAVILPVIDWHHGLSWTDARFALLAPGATAGLTLGLLMMVDRRPPLWVGAIPVLWTTVAGAHAAVLGVYQDIALTAAGLVALFWLIARARVLLERIDDINQL
jgi:hypothetical protein